MNTALQAIAAVIIAVLPVIAFGQSVDPDEHRQLHWNGTGGCVVEFVNTPCRTVRYHQKSFGSGLGFDGRTKWETVEAFDHDGSSSMTEIRTWRRWRLSPQHTSNRTEVILHKEEQVVVYIDHDHGVFEEHSGTHRPMPYWEEDDASCSHAASHSRYLSGRLPDSVVAGVNVVGYRGQDSDGVDYEVYFAPSIGCQQMRFQMVKRDRSGRITAESYMVVDSYVLGPPDPDLYSVPTAYKQVPSIRQFRQGRNRVRQ
jgi:hypothetical protein